MTHPQLPDGFQRAFESAANCDQQFDLVRQHFGVSPVRSAKHIRPQALYYLRGKQHDHLITPIDEMLDQDAVEMRMVFSGKALSPLPAYKLLEMGQMQQLYLLTSKKEKTPLAPGEGKLKATAEQPTEKLPVTAEALSDTFDKKAEKVLDMGAFTQLADAARRCGLVPNADAIGHTRDREFRVGNYKKAFQVIENVYGKFSAAATARQQRLRREDMDIKSGKTKMSTKEILAKRARDRAETQVIERTRSRFSRVMEGLRVLVNTGVGE